MSRAKLTEPYGYILKPFDELELRTTLSMALYKHKIEKGIREREQRLQAILNSIEDAVIGTDESGQVIFLNPKAEALTGYSADSTLGKPLTEVFNPLPFQGEPAKTAGRLRTFSGNGKLFLNRMLLKNSRGKTYVIEVSVAKLSDMHQKHQGEVIVFRDITDRQNFDQVLREVSLGLSSYTGETFFQNLVTSMTRLLNVRYAVISRILDHQRKLRTLAFSERGQLRDNFEYDIEGSPCEHVLGSHFIIYPHSVKKLFPNNELLQRMGIECYIGGPLFSGEKKPIGILMIMDDEPLQALERIETFFRIFAIRAEAELERYIAEQEKLNMEKQLRHIEKLKSLGILAGGIAHDFNNLLVGILGNAELALQEIPDGSPARDILEQIEVAGKRAAELTRQLLAYSGKAKISSRALNLSELIEDMKPLLGISVSKNIQLMLDLKSDLPLIKGDPTQIQQIVMNLITNASEAIGDGSGIISLSTGIKHVGNADQERLYLKDVTPPGEYVYIQVTDTGQGMDSETLQKIFDPFFTTKFTGRGLGLATVLGIVRGHKGNIMVESKSGQGTTFYVLFPAARNLQAGEDVSNQTSQAPRSFRGKGKVLVVDDEEMVRTMVRKILEQAGFDILLATDGQEAIQQFDAHISEIDLVVLDMTMPGLDGVSTFRRLREMSSNIPVILTSGYAENGVTDALYEEGLAGFIQKPFMSDALLNLIQTALKK
ncbi:MAG: response regulator [candidate division KSB1 bacterium]|nr:response regulator [candidate division KSB1 bacterium]